MIDLSEFYNGSLTEGWIQPSSAYTTRARNFGDLPLGVQRFVGIDFDVRGIIQLRGKSLGFNPTAYPAEVKGIPVASKCPRLHFLHGTGWRVPDGILIGHYVVQYADGATQEIPIRYGMELRDWDFFTDEREQTPGAVVAWTGTNDYCKGEDNQRIRLFKSTWENPQPEVEIRTIDFYSTYSNCYPFLIAITAGP